MGATLSDEERRLLILQAAYDQDLQKFTFLGATGVINNVFKSNATEGRESLTDKPHSTFKRGFRRQGEHFGVQNRIGG